MTAFSESAGLEEGLAASWSDVWTRDQAEGGSKAGAAEGILHCGATGAERIERPLLPMLN